MPCTTILVGRKASYDGSTMIARNDDSPSGKYMPKKFLVRKPDENKDFPGLGVDSAKESVSGKKPVYKSVLSHVEIELPEHSMGYTCVPNAVDGEGLWEAGGVNEAGVAMTATETIANNPRVLGADPLVEYVEAKDGQPEQVGGIGEEDIVTLVLPYIHSAKEGVQRLGSLLAQYGTYEINGIAFQDKEDIWWLETIGGHHFIAVRVPEDTYVVMPNQLGIDRFDLADAFGAQNNYMCSEDLKEFIFDNHLNVSFAKDEDVFNPRDVFGTHDDADHVYNTPRAWFMLRYLNPKTYKWDGPDADYTPVSDDLPWNMVPEKKITPEDVKYVLSGHFQGTSYDPYLVYGNKEMSGAYRSIGINRNDFMSLTQMRPDQPADSSTIQWLCFASNAFNVQVPFYANVSTTPEYFAGTTGTVSTDSFYWTSRLIAAMTDASYAKSLIHVERYQESFAAKANELIHRFDRELAECASASEEERRSIREHANEVIAAEARKMADDTLGKVLYETSNQMKNGYSRSDN